MAFSLFIAPDICAESDVFPYRRLPSPLFLTGLILLLRAPNPSIHGQWPFPWKAGQY